VHPTHWLTPLANEGRVSPMGDTQADKSALTKIIAMNLNGPLAADAPHPPPDGPDRRNRDSELGVAVHVVGVLCRRRRRHMRRRHIAIHLDRFRQRAGLLLADFCDSREDLFAE
jgi:hypothetical protein